MTYVIKSIETSVMAKRHSGGKDFPSRVRRMQELIMARSGVDEFYEVIRLILAKFYAEKNGIRGLPDRDKSSSLLVNNADMISGIVDGGLSLQSPNDIFAELQSLFDGVDIEGSDFAILDQAFEQLTARSYKSDKGQYFTPRHVAQMCAEALCLKPDEIICDPACGSAGLLKAAFNELASSPSQPRLYGFDYSHRACQVARLVSLIGAGNAIVVNQVDSLKLRAHNLHNGSEPSIEDFLPEEFPGFDAIITNPPFAGEVNAEAFQNDYELAAQASRRLERDVLFVERCVRLLKVGGRMAIVLPDNKVSGKGFRSLRRWMTTHLEIKSVVSLHRYTFLPYTSQKAAVVFGVRRPPSFTPIEANVAFIRSDRPGKSSNGSLVFRDAANLSSALYDALDHDLREVAHEVRAALCA